MKFLYFKYALLSAVLVFLFTAGLKAQPAVTYTAKNVSCFGAGDASMTLDVTNSDGSQQYKYYCYDLVTSDIDSVGPMVATSYTFYNLLPGPTQEYLFLIREVPSGLGTAQLWKFTQFSALNATVAKTDINCAGGLTGSIIISNFVGGSGQYDFTINGGSNWLTTAVFGGLGAGFYNVQMRDRANPTCIKILNANLEIEENDPLNANLAFTEPTCFNSDNGTITISSPTGGTGAYQYTITGAAPWSASGNFASLAPGTYNVIMRDQAVPTCTRTLNGALVFDEPALLQVNVSIAKGLTCNESSDGQLQANVSGGTSPYTYNWEIRSGGVWVPTGQTTPIAVNLAKGRYQVTVNDANGCGPAIAGIFFIEGPAPGFAGDSIPPVFYLDSASVVSTCAGQTNGSITIYARGGVSPFNYSITTGGAAGYQAGSLFSNLGAGSYETWAMDDRGCKKNGPDVTVATTPNEPVSVSIIPAPAGSICPGTSVTFTATPVNGGTTPAYQWRLNGVAVGSNSPAYTTSTLLNNDQVNVILTSNLRCVSGNPATSNTVVTTVNINTAIITQPQPVTQCAGTNATFSVVATGTNLTYQWRRNGTAIPGATASSYVINNIGAAHAGNYSVLVHGDCGADVISNAVALTVNPATAIITQPSAVEQCTGTDATFSVVAAGTNITYQWRRNGVDIPGANGSSYTINNIVEGNEANYSVLVHSDCGIDVISNNAPLTVNPATAITLQPLPVTQCAGTNATFTVGADGTNLTYQWRRNGTAIPGATASTYVINNISAAHAGNYSVLVHGDCGSDVISNAVALTVNPATAIITQPLPVTQCAGTNATFTVAADGTNITYQWRLNGVDIAGATASSYTINNIAAVHAGNYSVLVHSDCGVDVISNNALLTVNPATAITAQPLPVTQCVGTNATFTVTADGTNLTYQWRRNGTDISGATASSYVINNINAGNAGNYSVLVHGNCGADVISNDAALTVNPATGIITQPLPVAQCAGTNATFTVAAVGTNITYQWRMNGIDIPGANASSYTINNIAPVHVGNYSVLVHSDCGTDVTSNSVALTINPATSITTQPLPVTQCVGTNATFTVVAAGTNVTYQWRKNGTDIVGATSSSYTINNIAAADAGNYSVLVHGDCGPDVLSNAVALTVNPATAITTQPLPVIQCEGTDATFTVIAAGTNLTYQWRKNGTAIIGANASIFTINNIASADAGNYSVLVHGDCGSDIISNAVALTVNPSTAITVQPLPVTRCSGDNATFTVSAVGTNLTYQWRFNGVDIPGAMASSYVINNIDASDAGTYSVLVHGDCGVDVISNSVALVVNPLTVINVQPSDIIECEGNNATFTVDADGTGLNYQWKKDGIDISGATGSSYTIIGISTADEAAYSVTITGTCGTVTSNAAQLTVNIVPVITTNPTGITLCPGSNHTFSVTANGANLSYLWRKNGIPILPAETNATLVLNNIIVANAGDYDVVVSNPCGDVTTNVATLIVASNPVITAQPVDRDLCEGGDVTFNIVATGTGLTYQWRKDGNPIAGETGTALDLTSVTPSDNGNYDVVIYGMCDTIISNLASLIVYPATVADIVENDTLVCAGSTVELNVDADGSGMLIYQWQLFYLGAWVDISDNTKYSGTSTPTLTVQNVEAADTGEYRCQVVAGCGIVYTSPVRLDVNVIIATIGTPAPFLINSPTTSIVVGVTVEDHFLIFDMGFSLVAPDGTEVMLKYPESDPCVYNSPVDVNAKFTNALPSTDTMDYCQPTTNLTGTFGAKGDWSILNGMDPSNGAWQIRVYDNDRSTLDPDGYLTSATLTFIDLDSNGDTAVVSYNSGTISEEILNPIAAENKATPYIVPIRLMTSCFNSEDAIAIVTVDGGVAPFTYSWSGPTAEDPSATVELGPGTYTVTVTDAIGCSATASVDVTAPPAIVYNDVQHTDTITCYGSPDGVIRAKASGGSGGITYTLLPGNIPSTVADSGVFVNLVAGTYTVRATDLNDCSFDTVIYIYQYPELVVNITIIPDLGNSTGSIVLVASGGVPPYQYSIDNGTTLQPGGTFTDLAAGIYPVYVIDSKGCIFTEDVNLTVDLLDVDVVINNVSCYGLADGSFYLAALDGTGPYTLTGSHTADRVDANGLFIFTGQEAGDYDIRIEDIDGRIFIDTIHITEPDAIWVSSVVTNATCSFNTADGAIDITVTGGSGVFEFEWSNGATSEDISNVVAGDYSVVISDANGCSSVVYNDSVLANIYVMADAGDNSIVCPADTFTLAGDASADYDSLRWEPGILIDEPTYLSPNATLSETTIFSLTVYKDVCYARALVTKQMAEPVDFDIYEVEMGVGFTLLDSVLYVNEGESRYIFAGNLENADIIGTDWEPDTWIDFNSGLVTPFGDITYAVTGYTIYGCKEYDTLHIIIRRPIKPYTGFSPNADGINDIWEIDNALGYGDLINVRVFNRWGEVVFESRGYDIPWDGTRNGRQMPVGSYFYIIDVKDGNSKPYTGIVTILR